MKKKIISIILAWMFLVNLAPISVYADNQDKNVDVESSYYENSTEIAPDGYELENTFIEEISRVKSFNKAEKEEEIKRVLLIEDNDPWRTQSNQIVLSQITEFDKISTSEFLSVDLAKYGMVVFANDQSFSMYENYRNFKEQLELFTSIGGVVVFGACDSGWASGVLTENLPGDVKKENHLERNNYIVDETHPIISGSLIDNQELLNEELSAKYCSHVTFVEDSLPAGSKVILRESTTNKPTLVEYPLGKGRIIASGLTWEHNYKYGGTGEHEPYSRKAMLDLFNYGLYVSDINEDDIEVLHKYNIDKNVHSIFIGDVETQKPIKNAIVRINNYEVKTDENGLASLREEFGVNNVEISADSYKNSMYIYDVRPRQTRYFYLTKKKSDTQPYFLYLMMKKNGYKYMDLKNQVYHFTEDSNEMCNILLKGEWGNNTAGEYFIYQRGASIKSSNGNFRIAPGKIFKPGENIYAYMIGKDGKRSKPMSIGIVIDKKVVEENSNKVDGFSLGKEMGFKVGKDLPIIGGSEFKINLDFIPVTFVRDGKNVKFGIGITDAKQMKNNWNDFKQTMDKVKRNTKQTKLWKELSEKYGSKKKYLSLKKGWTPEMKVAGYGEGVIDENGKITQIKGYVILNASAMYKHQMQFIVGPVPVYFEIGGGVEMDLSTGISKILQKEGSMTVEMKLVITPKFSIGGGVGIVGALTVGASGNAEMPITIDKRSDKNNYQEVKLIGSMKLTASALFIFSAEKEIARGEWTLYDSRNRKDIGNSLARQESAFDLMDSKSYKSLSRNYLSDRTMWNVNNNSVNFRGIEDNVFTILQESVLPSTIPQVIEVEDKMIMIFQGDDIERADNNRTILQYSVYENGTWSVPKAVWDNGNPDFFASFKTDGINTYVVWQKAAKKYENADGFNGDPKKAIASVCEIAVASWNSESNSFEGQQYLTDNNTLDMMPSVSIFNGEPHISWVNNDKNDIFGIQGEKTIFKMVKKGDQWSEKESVITTEKMIIANEIKAIDNENDNIVYSLDSDNQLNTINDIELFMNDGINSWQLTQNNIPDIAPKFFKDKLYWYSDGLIEYNIENSSRRKITSNDTSINSTFKFLNNENGKEAIVWTSNVGENKTAIKSAIKNGDSWAFETELVRNNREVQFFDGIITDKGEWNFIINGKDIYSNKSSIEFARVLPKKDITLNDVYEEDYKVNNDKCWIINTDINNTGDQHIEELVIKIYDSENNVVEKKTVGVDINPGDNITIPVKIQSLDISKKEKFNVEVTTPGESNISDNRLMIELGYTDISVQVEKYVVEEKIIVVSQVSNLSRIPSNVAITILENSEDGIALDMKNLGLVKPGEDVIYTYEINKKNIDFADDEYKSFHIKVDSLEEDKYQGNNYQMLVVDAKEIEEYTGEPGELFEIINVTGVNILNEETIVIIKDELDHINNQKVRMEVELYPRDASFKGVEWKVEDNSIVEVDSNGLISALKCGKTNVTVISLDGNYTDTISVEVKTGRDSYLSFEAGEGGYIKKGISGHYKSGEKISIKAVPKKGYKFDRWLSSAGGVFQDINSESTVFTIPQNDTIITAHFKKDDTQTNVWISGNEEKTYKYTPKVTGKYRVFFKGNIYIEITNSEGKIIDKNYKGSIEESKFINKRFEVNLSEEIEYNIKVTPKKCEKYKFLLKRVITE